MALDLCPYHGERLLPPPMMSQPGLLLNGAAEAGDAVPLSPYHRSQSHPTLSYRCASICTALWCAPFPYYFVQGGLFSLHSHSE